MTTITAYTRNTITTANGTTAPATYSINARGTVAITAAVTTEDGQKTIRLYIAPDHPDYAAARAAAEPETVTIEAPAPAAVDVAPAEAVTAETPAPVKARKARKTAPRSVEYKGVTLAPNLATINGVTYPAFYSIHRSFKGSAAYVRVSASESVFKICYRALIMDVDAEYEAVLAIAKKSSDDKWMELMNARAEAETAAAEVEPETVEATAAAEVEPETVETTAAAEVEPETVEATAAAEVESETVETTAAAEVEKPAAPAAKTPVAKPWIGSTITGNGWRIVFDEAAQRTRVIFDTPATEKQVAAVAAAGFYWSPTMQSYNKGLKCKAYRAAQELAKTLATVA